jgi:uncharacterized protein YgiM (DUF1202 family)
LQLMNVAQRAASLLRRGLPLVAAATLAASTLAFAPQPADAATAVKVVIVVGPSGSATDRYLTRARAYASRARSYGASVQEIYTPNATWSRVRTASQGANIFIYLGHGNGWPSPYGAYNTTTKNGLGLNAYLGSGNVKPTYYGSSYIGSEIRFAPGAIVLLNHLCYASGNAEPGMAEPTWDVARQRVDNYAMGFLRAGAKAVMADGHTSLARELDYLFGASRNLLSAWKNDPDGHGNVRSFASIRTPGFTTYLDPDSAYAGFYRSLVTTSTFSTGSVLGTTASVQSTTLAASATTTLRLRSGPGTSHAIRETLAAGTRTTVTGALVSDAAGRTWAPVKAPSGRTGYIAAWHATFTGSAQPTTAVVLRSSPSTSATARMTVASGTRVTVLDSRRDASDRVWFSVRTSTGVTGWMAGWLMRP